MKKIISTLFLAAVCSTSFAQLIVQSDGKVVLNCTPEVTAVSKVAIGGAGQTNYHVGVSPYNMGGMYISKYTGWPSITIASNYGTYSGSQDYAINVFPSGGVGGVLTKAYGIHCYSGVTQGEGYAVCGKVLSAYTPYASSGIYGSSTTVDNYTYSGIYAGYFNGDVRVTGTLYGALLTPSLNSGNTSESGGLSERSITDVYEESVSDKLQQVQLLQFTTNSKAKSASEQQVYTISYPEDRDATQLTEEDFKKMIEEHQNDAPVQTKMADIRYGLAADQLKAVYPELVYEDKDGNVSINYMEMIPLLVQALNEQQARIDALEGKSEPARKSKAAGVEAEDADILAMSQNVPNPFTESTEIQLNIPQSVKTAAVFFYDMTGKQVDKRIITERGATTLSVSGTDLTEGMYLYSLIADGKVISTKKMFLTK